MTVGPVAGIVLAAGLSRRAGPVDKLVARVDGEPMVWHPVRTALAAGLEPVVVVTRAPGTGAYEALGEMKRARGPVDPGAEPLLHVVNSSPERGLASSLHIGVSALAPETRSVVVVLGDMPWVKAETIRALVEASRQEPEAACVPVYEGRWGNPVLWPAACFDMLRQLGGDQGARMLLTGGDVPVHPVRVDDPGIHRDMDTLEDLGG